MKSVNIPLDIFFSFHCRGSSGWVVDVMLCWIASLFLLAMCTCVHCRIVPSLLCTCFWTPVRFLVRHNVHPQFPVPMLGSMVAVKLWDLQLFVWMSYVRCCLQCLVSSFFLGWAVPCRNAGPSCSLQVQQGQESNSRHWLEDPQKFEDCFESGRQWRSVLQVHGRGKELYRFTSRALGFELLRVYHGCNCNFDIYSKVASCTHGHWGWRSSLRQMQSQAWVYFHP